MLDTVAKASTGATRETLTWRALKPVILEAVEVQDADNPALITLVICPRGSTSLGAALISGPSSIPGGQITWTGRMHMAPEEEIRGYIDYSTAADRLFLSVKVAP